MLSAPPQLQPGRPPHEDSCPRWREGHPWLELFRDKRCRRLTTEIRELCLAPAALTSNHCGGQVSAAIDSDLFAFAGALLDLRQFLFVLELAQCSLERDYTIT